MYSVSNPPPVTWLKAEEIGRIFYLFAHDDTVGFDYETRGLLDCVDNRIIMFGISGLHARVIVNVHFHEIETYRAALIAFLKSKKVFVYNSKFEQGITKQFFDEWIYFDDAFVLMTLSQSRATLKENAVAHLGVDYWADKVDEIRASFTKLAKKYDIVEVEALTHVHADLTPATIADKTERLKAGEISDFECVPYRVLGEYCAADCYYTLLLGLDYQERHADYYPYFVCQSWLSGIMELYGTPWDDTVAEAHDAYYKGAAVRHLRDLILTPGLLDMIARREIEETVELKGIAEVQARLKAKELPAFKYVAVEFISGKLSRNSKLLDKFPPGIDVMGFIQSEIGSYNDLYETLMAEEIQTLDAVKQSLIERVNDPLVTVEDLKALFNPESPRSARHFWHAIFAFNQLESRLYAHFLNYFLEEAGVHLGKVATLDNIAEIVAEVELIEASGRLKKGEYILNQAMARLDTLKTSTASEYIEDAYKCMKAYGVDIDDEATWTTEFRILRSFRLFKKVMKSSSVYINGDKVGRGAVKLAKRGRTVLEPPILLGDYRKGYQPRDDEYYVLLTPLRDLAADTLRWKSGLHTIPSGSELREMFRPRFANTICLHYDYSGAEIRVLAKMANEQSLLDAFERGEDVHKFVASKVFNKPISEVTKEERKFSKTATFSILYGKGIESFAADFTNGDVNRARELFDLLFTQFPGIKTFIDKMHSIGVSDGYVLTLFGNRLPVTDKNIGKTERNSVNYPIQSSSSTMTAVGIWHTWEMAQAEGVQAIPMCFCHDAADWEVYIPQLVAFLKIVNFAALDKTRADFGVPVAADFEIGFNQNDTIGVTLQASEGDAIHFHFHGTERALMQVKQGLQAFYEVGIEVTKVEMVKVEAEALFAPKQAYNRYFGVEQAKLHGELKLRPRLAAAA